MRAESTCLTYVWQAHYLKAESCYLSAEFEASLLHYHRASALRPGVRQYGDGVKKAQRAIENSIGGRKRVTLLISVQAHRTTS